MANITRNSARKNRANKKAKYLANCKVRAALYQEFRGEKYSPKWHETLKALSAGTAT